MATKLEMAYRELRERFTAELQAAFKAKYGIEIESRFNIFAMQLLSGRVDGVDFTPEQHAYISGYDDAFAKAMHILLILDNQEEDKQERRRRARGAA